VGFFLTCATACSCGSFFFFPMFRGHFFLEQSRCAVERKNAKCLRDMPVTRILNFSTVSQEKLGSVLSQTDDAFRRRLEIVLDDFVFVSRRKKIAKKCLCDIPASGRRHCHINIVDQLPRVFKFSTAASARQKPLTTCSSSFFGMGVCLRVKTVATNRRVCKKIAKCICVHRPRRPRAY